MSDQGQASSDDGSWESKSDRSLPSSDHEQDPADDQLEPDLKNYILQHKDELTIDTIKSFYRLLATVKQTDPNKSLEQYINHLQQARQLAEQELDLSKKEAEKFKCKSRQLQDQLTKELSTFDTLRVDNILKNSGCKQFVDALKSTIKTKEETISSQKESIKRLEREYDNLDERLKRSNKLIDEQRKALQAALAQSKSNDFEFNRGRNLSNQGSVVLDNSLDFRFDSSLAQNIPPPPMVEPDIMRLVSSPPGAHITSTNSSSYNLSLIDKSIPPPPHVEVNLDEILRNVSSSNGNMSRG